MSVINKMLKDLDHRSDVAGAEAQSPINQNYVPSTKSRINWLLLVMCLIFIALVVIGWQLATNNTNQTADSVPSISGNFPAEPDPAKEQELSKALAQQPVESLENGTDKKLSDFAAKKSQQDLASNIAREPNIKPQKSLATPSVEAASVVQQKQVSTPDAPLPALASPKVTPDVAEGNIDKPEQVQAVVALSNNQQSEKAQSSGQFIIERSNVDLTPEQRVDKLFSTAKKSFDKGYISDGIDQLEQLLAMADGHIEARNLLAGAWYGRGESNRAISILNNGLQRYPNVEAWRLTAAKIFFKENNSAGALSYLDINIADASKEFLTMKGSLGRQLQQFDKSEQAYGQLTKMEPNVGNWWLGLAIALDSQGKLEQALESYQVLVLKGGVSADSMAFARQRIVELKG